MLMHEIRLKRVYEVPSPDDGVRVLVDRLWPRGIRKADLPYDAWPKEITPSPELRKLYHRGEMPFAGFREGYAEELEASEGAAAFAERCRKWLETQDVTLLYAAKNQQEDHAQVLAAWLRQKSGAEGGA